MPRTPKPKASRRKSPLDQSIKPASPVPRPFPCFEDGCTKSFARAHDRHRHSLTHMTPEEREKFMLPCPYEGCDHKTLQKSNMDTHIRTHTGEKPLKCPDCDYETGDPGSFSKHQKKRHGPKSDPESDKSDNEVESEDDSMGGSPSPASPASGAASESSYSSAGSSSGSPASQHSELSAQSWGSGSRSSPSYRSSPPSDYPYHPGSGSSSYRFSPDYTASHPGSSDAGYYSYPPPPNNSGYTSEYAAHPMPPPSFSSSSSSWNDNVVVAQAPFDLPQLFDPQCAAQLHTTLTDLMRPASAYPRQRPAREVLHLTLPHAVATVMQAAAAATTLSDAEIDDIVAGAADIGLDVSCDFVLAVFPTQSSQSCESYEYDSYQCEQYFIPSSPSSASASSSPATDWPTVTVTAQDHAGATPIAEDFDFSLPSPALAPAPALSPEPQHPHFECGLLEDPATYHIHSGLNRVFSGEWKGVRRPGTFL
ncbi:hypothetical protein C8R47DRAFT_393192 [Mycena vitilis]|nr:hypothetical protein C8R47DRAFT_393192 [Mycena vitilis]